MTRRLIEGREFSTCSCGNTTSANAKQCRECYRKNKGHHAEIYARKTKAAERPLADPNPLSRVSAQKCARAIRGISVDAPTIWTPVFEQIIASTYQERERLVGELLKAVDIFRDSITAFPEDPPNTLALIFKPVRAAAAALRQKEK